MAGKGPWWVGPPVIQLISFLWVAGFVTVAVVPERQRLSDTLTWQKRLQYSPLSFLVTGHLAVDIMFVLGGYLQGCRWFHVSIATPPRLGWRETALLLVRPAARSGPWLLLVGTVGVLLAWIAGYPLFSSFECNNLMVTWLLLVSTAHTAYPLQRQCLPQLWPLSLYLQCSISITLAAALLMHVAPSLVRFFSILRFVLQRRWTRSVHRRPVLTKLDCCGCCERWEREYVRIRQHHRDRDPTLSTRNWQDLLVLSVRALFVVCLMERLRWLPNMGQGRLIYSTPDVGHPYLNYYFAAWFSRVPAFLVGLDAAYTTTRAHRSGRISMASRIGLYVSGITLFLAVTVDWFEITTWFRRWPALRNAVLVLWRPLVSVAFGSLVVHVVRGSLVFPMQESLTQLGHRWKILLGDTGRAQWPAFLLLPWSCYACIFLFRVEGQPNVFLLLTIVLVSAVVALGIGMLAQRVLQPYLWEPSLWAALRINDAERAATPLTDRPHDDASRDLAEDDAFFRDISAEWGVPWEPMDNPDGAGIASQDTDSPAAVYMDSDADVDVLSDEEGDDEDDEDYQSTESSADEDEEGKSGASSSGFQSSPERSSKHIDRARRVARRILAFTRPLSTSNAVREATALCESWADSVRASNNEIVAVTEAIADAALEDEMP